ncbi:MAG TPA: SEC-C domain-containing protein [Solirubrobacteraceae bacterium]|nr:SEC-C domain-containing protein [Solirubrobacteraceae bacterium]
MSEIGRNAPCPCGSGLKYKRCCLRRRGDVALDALEAERVWSRLQSWALERFGDEIGAALKEHMDARGVGGKERPANDEDLSLALCWLLIDRDAAAGDTPARLYSRLPELPAGEREMAERIAASRLGVYRVTDVQAGAWIELESAIDGASARVASPNVSREAALWHVLLCRVMEGGPTPSLWGAAAFYEPAEEVELVAELRRIADAHRLGAGPAGLQGALRVGARELVCFVPPSRRAERVPYTLEGDPAVVAEATWNVRVPGAALIVLRAAPELAFDGPTEDGEGVTFDWLTSRRALLARRPPLPVGAICLESGPAALDESGELEPNDLTSLGTFTLREDRLEFFGLSERRLDGAVALIERTLGRLVDPPARNVRTVQEASAAHDVARAAQAPPREGRASGSHTSSSGRDDTSSVIDTRLRNLTYRRWIDDPNEKLRGLSPREARARDEHREELERQLRSLEHHSALERRDRAPAPELTWMRAELGLDHERVAA